MDAGDTDSLISACIQYGDAKLGGDPQLWADALEYLCMRPEDCTAQIVEVMGHIEEGAVLPPLVVLQTLAKNKNLKVCKGLGVCIICWPCSLDLLLFDRVADS